MLITVLNVQTVSIAGSEYDPLAGSFEHSHECI